MTRRFGPEATTYLAEPLLAGIHAGDVDRLSLRALFPRFADAEREHGSLIRAFRRRAPTSSMEGAFKSLPGGLGEMVVALVKRLPAGSVQTDAGVARIDRSERSPVFRIETTGGGAYESRALALSTPAYVTAALLRNLDPDIARLCAEIPYSSIATVALAFSRKDITHPLNGSGYVVPRTEDSGILAATWLSSKWPNRAPEGKVLLRTFIGGARDPEALALSDAELVARSLAAMRPVLGIGGDPLFTRVYRFDRASAQYEVGHLDRITTIDQRLASHSGLFLTGSGFRGVGVPDCITDARATADQAVDWLKRTMVTTENKLRSR
jgi:oxygen-dependent protoporphyrinogen oxidase